MGLQFVVGDVRTGKSGILYQEGIRRQEEEGGRVLFVVPEQATLVVQQELIACHPRHAFQDMDVLSFGRLAYHVFEELEITLPPLLDETGKAMVLRKALSGMEKNLQIFRGSMYKPGFIQELKSVLSELDQYRITGKMLKEAMEKLGEEDRLALKIREVESIQKAFRAEIGDLFHTGEEVLDVLAAHVPESVYLAEASLYLDGFTGFTPVQYHLLGVLMKHVKDIWVSIPLPSPQMLQQENRPHERYSLSKGMAIRLQQLAAENGVEVYPIRQSPLKQPFLAPVSIIQGGNPREELVWVREKIEALVREKGVHYRDMAIVTGDLSIYGRLAKEVFSREVPCFIDETRHLQSNLVILLLESALEVAAAQFSYESVFRYVKNGLRKSLPEESLLENYVLAFRIRGAKKWEEAWIRGAGNFSQEDMDLVNKARERVGAPLLHLKTALQKETVEEKLKGVRLLGRNSRAKAAGSLHRRGGCPTGK